jgi:hypothetical protein
MMNQRYRQIALAVGLGVATVGATAAAQQSQQGGARPDDPQIVSLIERTNRDARQFDRAVDLALGKNPNWPVNPTQIEDDVDQLVNELTDTTMHLQDHWTRRQVINTDVEDVLTRGARIDAFMRRNQLAASAEDSWLIVRRDLDELAHAFNVDWNWASPRMTPTPGPAYYNRLSGTYQLDRARSDNAQRIADQATRGLDPAERERVQRNLINRLEPPAFISLDRNGRTVRIASSLAPEGTFDIDGRSQTEPNAFGGVSTVRASLYGDELMVTTTGNRGSDFTLTFEPIDAGNTLRVTRRLDAAGLPAPVQAESFYRRTSEQPRWNLYNAPPSPPATGFLVPEGTVLVGRLSTALGSRTSRPGDRFSLTVSGPQPFQGAVIDGTVARVNGSNQPGRNDVIVDFDRISLRDGRTARFEGMITQVRTPDGTTIAIDTEGVVRSGQGRGDDAVQRGAIGAGIGAVLGAIIGGGKGAAIGAAAGAGAGAGSVYMEGRDLYLPRGTEVYVMAQTLRYRH